MNALVKTEQNALVLTESELLDVLGSSLYPGANPASIKMVLGYCKAAGLDPMQKPVHIVPMWDGKAKQMRDVVMPGVGLYRTQAARTDRFAGQTEPEFGPMVTEKLGGVEITYPEWAQVTIKKIMGNGTVAEFTAREYWIENYAVKGGQEKSIAPNAMWMKRPRGQIAKCAGVQALRLAFPEMGAQPTAEEMEGKQLDEQPAERHMGPAEVVPTPPATYPDDQFEKNLPVWLKVIADKRKTADQIIAMAQTKHPLTEWQQAMIHGTAAESPEPTGEIVMSFAQVAQRLNDAKDLDKLAEAASLICTVADEGQRAELTALYDRRGAEFQ